MILLTVNLKKLNKRRQNT